MSITVDGLPSPGWEKWTGLACKRSAHNIACRSWFSTWRALANDYRAQAHCEVPSHVLFPQLGGIVQRYLNEKVRVHPPADIKDIFLAPYYGWVIEALLEHIHGDIAHGEMPEIPRYEGSRGPGSTSEVDLWTSREVREITRSHL